MSSVTLSASIRQNLLSLQNTTRLLDLTANRLSTGKRVNSALDNPGSFFTARSLTNRAQDLNARKDSIGQAISLLQATDKSITSLTSLVEQAKAKAQQADEAATGGVKAISTEKATTITGITKISTVFTAGPRSAATVLSTFGVTDNDDLIIVANTISTTLTIVASQTIATLVAEIQALNGVSASWNTTTYQIDITGNGGSDINIKNSDEVGSDAYAGLGGFAVDGVTLVEGTAKTFAGKNDDTDLLEDMFGVTNGQTIITFVTDGTARTFTSVASPNGVPSTIADLVADITAADTALTASYNTTTSKIEVKAAEGVSVDFTGTGFTALTLNDGKSNLVAGTDVTYSKFGSESEVGALTLDFQSLLSQMHTLISDASYKGKNLLKGGVTRVVKFNALGDSKLTITGKDLAEDSLGVLTGMKFSQKATAYDFKTATNITTALADVNLAITELRTISSTFGTSLGIIQTREDFTVEMVNALEAGAGKLVNASLEEESANLLALQTRQALGIQSLAIANQSQQSILALFR